MKRTSFVASLALALISAPFLAQTAGGGSLHLGLIGGVARPFSQIGSLARADSRAAPAKGRADDVTTLGNVPASPQ